MKGIFGGPASGQSGPTGGGASYNNMSLDESLLSANKQ
jgi:hypothetical protein